MLQLAGRFAADELQLYYQIAVQGRSDIGLAPDEYAGFTMTLLRMLADELTPESGEVRWGRGARIGFLLQNPVLPPGTVRDV